MEIEELQTIGKQVKRDISRAIKQGRLPDMRYSVRTRWRHYDELIINSPDDREDCINGPERETLIAIVNQYLDEAHNFLVMIDGTSGNPRYALEAI